MRQQTSVINAIRAHLAEFGIVAPVGRQGVEQRIMPRELLRRVDVRVMLENRLDALVRLHTPLPPGRIGGAPESGVRQNLRL